MKRTELPEDAFIDPGGATEEDVRLLPETAIDSPCSIRTSHPIRF